MTISRYARPCHAQHVCNIAHGRQMPDRPRKRDALAHLTPGDPNDHAAPTVDVADAELVARMLDVVAGMSPQARAVIEARLDGATLKEAGAVIGRSGQRALQIERQAHAKVRDRLSRWVENEPGNWRAGGEWRVR